MRFCLLARNLLCLLRHHRTRAGRERFRTRKDILGGMCGTGVNTGGLMTRILRMRVAIPFLESVYEREICWEQCPIKDVLEIRIYTSKCGI